jgi:Tfp pilus assembly protein PilO
MSSSYLRFFPFTRWSLVVHVSAVLLLLLTVWGLGYGFISNAQYQLVLANQAKDGLNAQTVLHTADKSKPLVTTLDFTQSLPNRKVVDELVRDMGRNAQRLNVALGTLMVTHQDPTVRELGKVQLTLTATGEYNKTKAWLSESLARYPHIAIQTLSVRGATEVPRQEWQLALVLYVKD